MYDNGASSIVDTIYQNTPENIQKGIKNSYLTKNTAEKRMTTSVQEGMDKAGKTAAKIGMATAFAPALIQGAALAPITTGLGMLGAYIGGQNGKKIGRKAGLKDKSTYLEDGFPVIEHHPYSGEELGEFVGSTIGAIPMSVVGAAGDALVAHKTNGDFWGSLTNVTQENGKRKFNLGWELRPEYENVASKYQDGVDTSIRIFDRPTISQIPETLDAIKAAEESVAFNKKHNTYPEGLLIYIMPGRHLAASYHNRIGAHIGTRGSWFPRLFGFTKRGLISHEIGHGNPLFNTEGPSGQTFIDSPLYDFDYSKVPAWAKKLLKPTGLRQHARELSESYSDLMATREMMSELGYGEGPYSLPTLLKYKLSPMGLANRFFRQHPGLLRQLRLLNDVDFSNGVLENMELPEEQNWGGITLKNGGTINRFKNKLKH